MIVEYIKDNILNLKSDQLKAKEIHENVLAGVRLKGAPFIILFCAIIIASVGLNTNSTAVVIGAMLISPLMSPIIAIGYSIATYDLILLRNAGINFGAQILISLAGATLYFWLSPLDAPTSELIARTGPSYFDMLIAFFGGTAGIIGITRKEKTNVIPGVAIATALMPPMCTVGYGLANLNPDFIFSAGYLFVINAFFIVVATFLFCKLFQLKQAPIVKERYNKLIKRGMIIGVILISIPATASAGYYGVVTVQDNILYSNIENFVTQEVNSETTTTMNTTVFEKDNSMRLDLIGEKYSLEEINKIRNTMKDYHLGKYRLEVIQDVDTSLFNYFNGINKNGFTENRVEIVK
jgi:uncharacterized hydrophobic protein (TIGR00271 family)